MIKNNNPNPFLNQQRNVPAPSNANAPQTTGKAKAAPPPSPSGNMAMNNQFDIDLTEVQAGAIIPDGNYLVKCTDVEQGISQAGNPQLIWTFEIVGGEYAGTEFKFFTAMTPAALWKVAEATAALGIGGAGQRVKFSRSDVLNRQCSAVIEETEYKGQVRSSITALQPLGA